MRNPLFVRSLIVPLIAGILCLGLPQASPAGMVGTDAVIESKAREARIERVNAGLAREHVRNHLIAFGVSPDDARRRIARLSDAELQTLETRLGGLPAGGGVLEVIGIVFVVLLILELLDVTDLFTGV